MYSIVICVASLGWIGHSQGTLMMFGLLADQPHYSLMVKPFIAMAPVCFVDNIMDMLVDRFGIWFILVKILWLVISKDLTMEPVKILKDIMALVLPNSLSHKSIYSKSGQLGDNKDVARLIDTIKVPLLRDYFVPLPSWNYLDFIYGKDIYTYVHQEILKILQSTY